MTDNRLRWSIGLASTAFAVVCLYSGSEVRDDSFWSSVLVNAGTAFLLAIPAILAERVFDRRITKAKDDVDEHITKAKDDVDERLDAVAATVGNVSSRLDKLTQDVVTAVEKDRDQELATAVDRADDVSSLTSWETVREALVHGRDTHATTPDVFVPLPEQRLTLRFVVRSNGEVSKRLVGVTVIPDDPKAPRVGVAWGWKESVEDLFRNLDAGLRREYGRNAAPRLAEAVSTVFTMLARTMEAAQVRRLQLPGPDNRRSPVIELATDNWLVTTDGLEKVGDPSTNFDRHALINAAEVGGKMPATDDPELSHALATAYRRLITERDEFRR